MEEITDNRPRIIKYKHDCAELNNGVGLEVTEEVAIALSQTNLQIDIYDVDRETQDETLQETITIDISSLLYPKTHIDVSQRI